MTESPPSGSVPKPPDLAQPEHQRLPVSEVAFDRPGGPSPFGEDIAFPLPAEHLRYRHK